MVAVYVGALVFCIFATLLTWYVGHSCANAWEEMKDNEANSPLGKAIWAVGFCGYTMAIILLGVSFVIIVLLPHATDDNDETKQDSIYYEDIRAQCESLAGSFNNSNTKPACYLEGKRVIDSEHSDMSNDNSSNDNSNTTKGGE